MEIISVEVSDDVIKLIDELLKTGFYGCSRDHVLLTLAEQRLDQVCALSKRIGGATGIITVTK